MENAEHDAVVMDLLESALAMPGDARPAYLRATAGTPEIAAEVIERAAWEERMAGFLQNSLFQLASSETIAADVPSGRRIGQYLVQEELGRGGMGVVFRAVDQNLGRTVALKVLSGAAGSALDRRRFLREAKAASALNHPNIVAIHEFDSDCGQDFIAMEYIEGKTLDQAITPGQPLPQRLAYARQIAVALASAHAAGIVHRDLKPRNIMVTKQGEVKVLDFGLAKREEGTALTSESEETRTMDVLSNAGALIGTPAYMSPEQVTGEPVDPRSDIFSFGVVLYEMVAGDRPFRGGNAASLLVQIAGKPHRPLRELNPAAPPALVSLIDRCLAKKPEDRLPSMDMAVVELSAILDGPRNRPRANRYAPWVFAISVAIAGAGAWLWKHPAAQQAPRAQVQAPPAAAVRAVRYRLLNDQGAAVPPGSTFRGGTNFRFRLAASNPGFLYLVNEGPGESGSTRLYVLMPRAGASAAVAANEERLTDRLVFDENPGIERMWVIWSDQPVRSLEDAANGPLRGEVRDSNRATEIQRFLGKLQSEVKTTQTGSGDEVQVQGVGTTLGSLIELRHQ